VWKKSRCGGLAPIYFLLGAQIVTIPVVAKRMESITIKRPIPRLPAINNVNPDFAEPVDALKYLSMVNVTTPKRNASAARTVAHRIDTATTRLSYLSISQRMRSLLSTTGWLGIFSGAGDSLRQTSTKEIIDIMERIKFDI